MWFTKKENEEEGYKYLLRIEVTFFYQLGKKERSLQRSYGIRLQELPTGDELDALRASLAVSPLFTFNGLSAKFEQFAKNWSIIALEQLVEELALPVNRRTNLEKLFTITRNVRQDCSKLSSCSFKFDYKTSKKASKTDHTAIVEFSIHKTGGL